MENGGRAIGIYIISGRVNRSGGEVDHDLGFDVDIAQWGAVSQQTIRFTCYFPTCHPRLTKTSMLLWAGMSASCFIRRLGVCWPSDHIFQRGRAHLLRSGFQVGQRGDTNFL